MPFQIIRNDITKVEADAIVNTANPKPTYDTGTDKAVYEAAGAEELLAERKKIGEIKPGDVALTPGFRLPAKYIIHAVGPVWRGGTHGEFETLKSCYDKSLQLALEKGCESIAFPLMATGNYGFPKDKALQIAMNSISSFCMSNDMEVTLVVFSDEAFQLSGKIYKDIDAFLDSDAVEKIRQYEYEEEWRNNPNLNIRRRYEEEMRERGERMEPEREGKKEAGGEEAHAWLKQFEKRVDEEKHMKNLGTSFRDKLLEYVVATGKKDSEIYHKAGVSKQVYSKILSNEGYIPKKNTALAFCMALHLSLEQTKDLIGRAGYALSVADQGDLLVEAWLINKQYDVYKFTAHYYEKTGKNFIDYHFA